MNEPVFPVGQLEIVKCADVAVCVGRASAKMGREGARVIGLIAPESCAHFVGLDNAAIDDLIRMLQKLRRSEGEVVR